MLKLVDLNTVGEGEHRSGWPYCIQALRPLFTEDAPVLFDDFVERTFLYDKKWHDEIVHTGPWVGVIHHPPDMPGWYMDNLHLQNLDSHPRWQASLPNLKMIISMGDNLTTWLEKKWPDIPVVTIRHPTGRPMVEWTPERYWLNREKKVVQVGWFLRNTTAIYQTAVPVTLKKAHLCQKLNWVEYAHWLCTKTYKALHPERADVGTTERISQLNDIDYDVLLAENVVMIEVISAVANNTVVECIARNTPLCINRHPGPVSYLGEDYPLYYDHFSQIPEVLTQQRIMDAHEYLRHMDKWWIRGAMFREQVRTACQRHVAECANSPTPVGELRATIQ